MDLKQAVSIHVFIMGKKILSVKPRQIKIIENIYEESISSR